jgi:Ras-related protein Rab-5C
MFFFDSELPTIGAAFRQTELDGVRLDIWDTAGQERYQAIAPLYYRGANVAVIVYDVTNKESLAKCKEWYNKLVDEEVAGDDGQVVVAIAANKCDCSAEQRMVPLKLGEAFAAKNGLLHFETSAKTGQGITEMFSTIVKKLPAPDDVDDGRVDIQASAGGGKKKRGCC